MVIRKEGEETSYQGHLFEDNKPTWIEVDLQRIAVERTRRFGGPWLGLELLRKLGLDSFIAQTVVVRENPK